MNPDHTIDTCRALAMQQYPKEAEQRHAYHVSLLETKLREVCFRNAQIEASKLPSATVIDLRSKVVVSD